jgi:hypothetical protein
MINQSIQDHHLDTTILSTEPNGIMVWTHHHKSLQEKTYTYPLFQRIKMIHNTKISCKANQILFQRTKMICNITQILQSKPSFCSREQKWSVTHTNLAKQTKFLFQRIKMIRNTQISVVNCKIMNELMNQQLSSFVVRFIMNEHGARVNQQTPPAYHPLDAHYDSVVDEPHPVVELRVWWWSYYGGACP